MPVPVRLLCLSIESANWFCIANFRCSDRPACAKQFASFAVRNLSECFNEIIRHQKRQNKFTIFSFVGGANEQDAHQDIAVGCITQSIQSNALYV